MGKKNNNIKTKTSGFKYTSGYQISPYSFINFFVCLIFLILETVTAN